MNIKYTIFIFVLTFFSCDPQRSYLLNNEKYYDEILCNEIKTFFFVSVSLYNETSSLTFKSKDIVNFKKLYVNNVLKEFNLNKYNENNRVSFNHRMMIKDTLKIEFEIDKCIYLKEYIIGEPEAFSVIFKKDIKKLDK